MTKTKFANGVNPFLPATEALKGMYQEKVSQRGVDVALLAICDDPIPIRRVQNEGKYDNLFKTLRPGRAVKCPPEAADLVSQAVKKFAKKAFPDCIVRSTADYGDGMGRVWLLKK